MRLNNLDLYSILSRIARYSPAQYDERQIEKTCMRLQTFAVLRSSEGLNTNGALEKSALYADKDIFFSRKWDANRRNPSAISFTYPGLFIWESNSIYSQFFKKNGTDNRTSFVFATMDKMPDGITGKALSFCERLTVEEKDQILRDMLSAVFVTMKVFQYIKGYLGATLVFEGWYHPNEIAKYIADGVIDSFVDEGYLDSYITTKDIAFDTVDDMFVDKLMGVWAVLEISLVSCAEAMDLDVQAIQPPVSDSFLPCCK